MKKIYLYSLPTCPKCIVLKRQLENEKIDFTLVENVEAIQDEMYKAKIHSIPFIQIGDEYIQDPTFKQVKEKLSKL